MSLAVGEAVAVASGSTWVTIATVTGDGTKQAIGFTVSCETLTAAFAARLSSPSGTRKIAQVNIPAGQSAIVVDAPFTIPNGQACILEAQQSSGASVNMDGTILGS